MNDESKFVIAMLIVIPLMICFVVITFDVIDNVHNMQCECHVEPMKLGSQQAHALFMKCGLSDRRIGIYDTVTAAEEASRGVECVLK